MIEPPDLPSCGSPPEAREPAPWHDLERINLRGSPTIVARRRGASRAPLILCHSFGTDHRIWEPLVRTLPEAVDVIAYDVRNHGPERRHATAFSMETAAEDLAALLDHLDLAQVFLAGISMGGFIAQEFAVRYPSRLQGMALMATRGKGAATGEERALAGERHGISTQLEGTLERWFSPAYLAEDGVWVRHVRNLLLDWNLDAWASGWRAIGSAGPVERLSESVIPTHCIAGADDVSSPPAVLRAISEVVPGSTFEVVPGPHLFPIEHPQPVARVLTRHLRLA